MDRELAQKWVDALESGKYQKGVGSLCSDGEYCCLGVLADIDGLLVKAKVDDGDPDSATWAGVPDPTPGDPSRVNEEYLPGDDAKRLGLSDGQQQRLAEINDTSISFEPVVAEIKRRWL